MKSILPIKNKSFNRKIINRLGLILLSAAIITGTILFVGTVPTKTILGNYLIVALLLFIFYIDIQRYNAMLIHEFKMLFLAYFLLVGNFLIAKGVYVVLEGQINWLVYLKIPEVAYLLPLSLAPLLMALLFDIHIALVMAIITSLLSGIWLKDPFYAVYVVAGGITAAFSVMKCRRRSCILRAGLFIGNVNFLTALFISFIESQLLTPDFIKVICMALANGLIVSILVSALLPILEYAFGLTTNISLLEWLDLNHPMMRSLLLEAPGTYHHSIVTANLVETSAEAIGVNPLQAKVGAYYHDIGKIKMSEYFIENQQGILNRHDKLTPSMSSLILIAHVKEGLELAKRYKLPKLIRDIIQQHHGTSLITYFYQKAKDLSENGDNYVSEENFRYPGPKPQTRVAALVMLADRVEAAARALDEPTPARISTLVDTIINKVFLDGQLDDCDLTLKDLHQIKNHFVYILTGIHHRRIDYPGFKLIEHESIYKKSTETNKVRHQKNRTSSQKSTSLFKSKQS